MQITKELSDELVGLQEDIAAQFCGDNFPFSGELYWTIVECIAKAKLCEMNAP
jgi:hypothetical protein